MNEIRKSIGLDVFLIVVSVFGVMTLAIERQIDLLEIISIVAYSILIGVSGTMMTLKLKGVVKVNKPTEKEVELKAKYQKWILTALAIATIGVLFWGKL